MNGKILAVAACAATVVMGVATVTPAQAEKCNGRIAFVPHSSTSYDLADGRTMMRNHDTGVTFTYPDSTFNGVQQDCSATFIVNPDGQTGLNYGYCDGLDKDGDVFWLSVGGSLTGGTWQALGGTGKFEDITNSGTWVHGGAFANGNFIILWEGECDLK